MPMTQQVCCKVGASYLGGSPTRDTCRSQGGFTVACAYCCNVQGSIIEAAANYCYARQGNMVPCPYIQG
jgi:hypothetical protein